MSAKRFNRTFILKDENCTRKAFFRIPNAKTGLKIAKTFGGDEMANIDLEGLAEIAAQHLVLLEEGEYPEQVISGLDELEFIFASPFIGLTLIKEFQEDISPLLQGLVKA